LRAKFYHYKIKEKIFFMLNKIFFINIIAAILFILPAYGQNQSSYDDGQLIPVTVEAPRPDWESKLSPGTVTVIRPDEKRGEQKTLAELLTEVAGLHVREVNGRGHYTTVSIRGSTSSQVGIFIDGVLSNLGGDAAVDISTIPIQNVERIEVYRGYVPVRFGGTFMGGVINIVTKKPEKTDIRASIGKSSFGGYQGSIEMERTILGGGLLVAFNHERSRGDFTYNNLYGLNAADYYQNRIDEIFNRFRDGTSQFWTDMNSSFNTMYCSNSYGMNHYPTECASYASIATDEDRLTFITETYWKMIQSEQYYEDMLNLYGAYGFTPEQIYEYFVEGAKTSAYLTDYELSKDNIALLSPPRKRRFNSYRNSDALIKWQNDNLFFKFAWQYIDRYIPNAIDMNAQYTDTGFITAFNIGKKQELTGRDLTVGWRNQFSNLDIGISVNYFEQTKKYKLFIPPELANWNSSQWEMGLRRWSRYDSKRLGFQLDGEYKLGNRNLIEFMANFSTEKLDIDGYGMKNESYIPDPVTYRPSYEQRIINAQLQDTITLDNDNTFFLTGSIKYNSSRIFGARPFEPTHMSTYNVDINQIDSKFTWQIAIKKILTDYFTLRGTYGTYYRLLNLYEIAGDGALILPQSVHDENGGRLRFPIPEEGTQWDISALLQTTFLNADANIQLTYFGRKSKNMLQLWRTALTYMSYINSLEGTTKGLELEASLAWENFDVYVSATRQNSKLTRSFDCWTCSKDDYTVHNTFTPEKEAYVRVNIRPFEFLSFFADLTYTGEMYVIQYEEASSVYENLTTLGFGAKAKLPYGLELVVGVKDFFNKEPNQRIINPLVNNSYVVGGGKIDTNVYYPNPGQTVYATLSYTY
jgi:vitamin B12 transporter